MSDTPSVFDYVDFREYLDAWFSAYKDSYPSFSHRSFAKRMGANDPSFLVNIISGRRKLQPEKLLNLMKLLGLSGEQAEYFQQLVAFGQAQEPAERDRAWAAIAELRSRNRAPEIDPERLLYVSRPVYPAVRELAGCIGFRPDPVWIASRMQPALSETEAADVLALLERLGLLERDGDRLRAAEPIVRTSQLVEELGGYGYHRENHRLAGEALGRLREEQTAESTAFLGITFAVPHARIAELRKMLWEAQLQVLHRCEAWETDCDQVMQLNIQLFPLSVRTGEDERSQ